ncbi:alpha/beta hydrolase [Aquimarina sp. ERC-38]|uniref:alpha/beta hydrolase n=1 Tax=Aquimarina sp. ERC-38 TaxID=2949996 RepID=UPI002246D357|nr:alpha/beta hydrolase [Aquimarina sp. ERC-38]UZO82038.1 alpha/beta hydrolase [Aquimarina sp. ERC-38]
MLQVKKLFILTFILINWLSGKAFQPIDSDQSTKYHIFYLHGRILEIQGKTASHPEYGTYNFDEIISKLTIPGAKVYAEVRKNNTVAETYALNVSKKIDSLIKIGIVPEHISVIGASKGAIIASHISHINKNPINYIFLAGNNKHQEQENNWSFHGQVLSIYEVSDTIAGRNYDYWEHRKRPTAKLKQIKLHTGLSHGFIYKPLPEWMEPTLKWIRTQSL